MPEWQVFHQIRCNEFAVQLRFWDNAMPFAFVQLISRTRSTFLLSKNRRESRARAILASALIIAVAAIVELLELLYSDFVTDRFHESEINFLGPSAPRRDPFRIEFSLRPKCFHVEEILTGSIVAAHAESVWHKRIRSRAAKGAASCPRPSGTTEGVTQSASFMMGLPGRRGPAEDKAVKVNNSGNRSDSVHAACSRGVSQMCSSFLIHVKASDMLLPPAQLGHPGMRRIRT